MGFFMPDPGTIDRLNGFGNSVAYGKLASQRIRTPAGPQDLR
jgi:hypothetical protein